MTTVDHEVTFAGIDSRPQARRLSEAARLKSPTILPALRPTPLITALRWTRCCFLGKTATESRAVILWSLGDSNS